MTSKKIFFTLLMLLLIITNCVNNSETKIPGIILENMDVSIDPKNDFYNYVNGNWMKTNVIPSSKFF